MERIAARSMGSWIGDSTRDVADGYQNYALFGLVAWGVFILESCGGALMGSVSSIVGVFLSGVVQCGLAGVALARLHGREADANDFQQDVGTHLQSVVAVFVLRLSDLLVLGVASLPGLVFIVPASVRDMPALMIPGVILLVVLMVPALAVWRALTWFTVPLIVDRHMDFWTALTTSVDCARRDLVGLLIFMLVLYGAVGFIAGILFLCTCSVALVLIAPLFAAIRMRAYRGYFGLQEDGYCPQQIVGYSTYGTAQPTWTWEKSARDEQFEAAAREQARQIEAMREREREAIRRVMESRAGALDANPTPPPSPEPPVFELPPEAPPPPPPPPPPGPTVASSMPAPEPMRGPEPMHGPAPMPALPPMAALPPLPPPPPPEDEQDNPR